MSRESARRTLAELFHSEFERRNIDPEIFAESLVFMPQKLGIKALLQGEESDNAAYGAAAVASALQLQPQLLAELFQEAYPIEDFKPRISFGSPGLGVGIFLIAPEGLDVMKLVDAMTVGCPLKKFYLLPSPYLMFGGFKNDANKEWSFSTWAMNLNGRERWPIALSERPLEVDTPYWFGHIESGLCCASPEAAWTFKHKDK